MSIALRSHAGTGALRLARRDDDTTGAFGAFTKDTKLTKLTKKTL